MKTVGNTLRAAIGLTALLGACSESPLPAPPAAYPAASTLSSASAEAQEAFGRYTAIGTSVSMGWRSDGVTAASQQTSWPAFLARMAGQELPLPLIQDPGCGAPLAAPLSSGVRVNGERAADPLEARVCADNEPGVARSIGNVAIAAATTLNALTATPETPSSITYAGLYKRVLATGRTQVSSMLAQDPEVVSVELGANELLGARSGVYLPGVTVFPVPVWKGLYVTLLNAVQSTARYAVVVGLVDNALDFPSFRTGQELWDARESFERYNVAIADDCGSTNSANVLFVAVRVPDAVARGAARAQAGLEGPHVLSCVNAPSASGIQDFVLGPEDVAAIDAQLAAMNAFIREQAAARGFAHFELKALYGRGDVKHPFNAAAMMESHTPYGAYISLDGFHPSALGARVLADAAADALNAKYQFGIGRSAGSVVASAGRR